MQTVFKMSTICVLIFLNSLLFPMIPGQQCRFVPVCDETNPSNNLQNFKGDKGDQGVPGKMGVAGLPGEAIKGSKGDPGDFQTYQQELEERFDKIELLLTPASCLMSSVYGRQTLRSGEEVFCDNGWTVFQRRYDGSVDFNRTWQDYKTGFGNLSGEFWLGLDKIHSMTNLRLCKLQIDLWDFNHNVAFAQYRVFAVEDESSNFKLHVEGYNGTAGDSFSVGFHNSYQFTTLDSDNDELSGQNCAALEHRQGGWWYKRCFHSSLNAPWGVSRGRWTNIVWNSWKGANEALKATKMKIRCD